MNTYGENIAIEMKILSRETRGYTRNFFCGNHSIDDYYRKKAIKDKSAVTYLFINASDSSIIAC